MCVCESVCVCVCVCVCVQMKRYDEVLDDYRQSVYRLRRLILLGSSQQCTQVRGGPHMRTREPVHRNSAHRCERLACQQYTSLRILRPQLAITNGLSVKRT